MNQSNQSHALLLELLIVIGFFALSAAVLSGVFSAGYQVSHRAAARDEAMELAQNLADRFYAGGEAGDILAGFTPDGEQTWLLQTEYYSLRVTCHTEEKSSGTLSCAEITARGAEETLFTLPVSRFRAGEVQP